MVVIEIANSDSAPFLYETNCGTSNDDLVRDLVSIWNMRIRLIQLMGGIRELAQYGPMKPPDKAGLDEITERYGGDAVVDKSEFYLPDPTGVRTGNGVGPHLSATIEKVIAVTNSVLSKVSNQFRIVHDICLSNAILRIL